MTRRGFVRLIVAAFALMSDDDPGGGLGRPTAD